MTVAMSDRDYAILVEAAAWMRHHAGADAPEYPRIDQLAHVVNGIARRRDSVASHDLCGAAPADRVAQRRTWTSDDPTGEHGMRVLDLSEGGDDPN